ncbi:MAG: hypothetical protein IPK20_16105 [Betaproteobacteria bacterium]|nr:hypothetical protein [Betaproteobacteria bacterium]
MTRGRSVGVLFLLVAFALIQTWAPLLHAHVAPAGSTGSGIHLPDGTALVPHSHGNRATVVARCGQDEGALVTAQTEHLRNDRMGVSSDPGRSAAPAFTAVRSLAAQGIFLRSSTVRAGGSIDAAPPFAIGPPLLV